MLQFLADIFYVLILGLGLETFFKFVIAKFKVVSISFTVFGLTHFYVLFLFSGRTQLLICNSKLITVFISYYRFGWTTDRLEEHSIDGTSW